MRHKLYKPIFTLLAIFFLGTAFAQKFDKNFTENFKVNKDVEIAINATNTDIDVATWSKNEVQVNAFIEIEGLSKEEAEKYLKNWNFEALGNKEKVQITSKGNNSFGLKDDIVIFNNMDFDFVVPEIKMVDMDTIVIPDMHFDFDFDFDSMGEIEKNMERKGRYHFDYHNGNEHIVIKTKEEWEKFKKSKKYEELKKSFKKIRHNVKVIDKKKIKESLKKAKHQIKNINKEEIKIGLEKVREALKNMKFNFNSNHNDLTINGKKIKIKKRLEIKVPKKATFNLNTKHCKVNLPNTVASGNVKYGTFNANNLNGGKLTINYSPVNINSLNACTLFLNNVTDAKIASVTNTTMSNNSSEVVINNLGSNVDITNEYGELTISNMNKDTNDFNLTLNYSDATVKAEEFVVGNLIIQVNSQSGDTHKSMKKAEKELQFTGKFNIKTKDNRMNIDGKFSTLVLKK
ncbi:hypothetical protein [Polaribacter cellanae]|uniref:Adhesin domain-containing protein n=1 Tax=Polaribacter cellanae TaxID=2818493 RepID=A0A975CNR3_9FLAO|nr:hypothetical protein [Polaribacter cellanae]QTE22973.1 hypothetical protein J3359_01485 [Polaribacter cellanae]